MDKVKHIEGAVLHHMYQEESAWFLELKEKGANQERLRDLFVEEFERYTNIEMVDLASEDGGEEETDEENEEED
jgi:hypothetical protein